QQNAFEDRLSVLFGQYDLSSEFYNLHSSSLFLNSSFGTGPEFAFTGRGGPSIFPETAVGGRVEVRPRPGGVVRPGRGPRGTCQRPAGGWGHGVLQRRRRLAGRG